MGMFDVGDRGECPHCRTTVLFELLNVRTIPAPGGVQQFGLQELVLGVAMGNDESRLSLTLSRCPHCKQPVITAERVNRVAVDPNKGVEQLVTARGSTPVLLWPQFVDRPIPSEVPEHIAQDYREAAAVLTLSPKASAALSRRCLQTVLREHGHSQHDLAKQIDSALATLPHYIAEGVDAIRNIGNFAAHQQKSTASGEILDVEPGEAEWNLDVLDELFDFYYVKPAQAQKKRDALNQRLTDAGKPPMK